MKLEAFEKLVITAKSKRTNGRVIGIKNEENGTTTYFIEPLRVDFSPFTHGSKIMRVSSTDIETNAVNIEKHIV